MKDLAATLRKYRPDADTLKVLLHLPDLYNFLAHHIIHLHGWHFAWIWATN